MDSNLTNCRTRSDLVESAELVQAKATGLDRTDLCAELGLEGRVLAVSQLDARVSMPAPPSSFEKSAPASLKFSSNSSWRRT